MHLEWPSSFQSLQRKPRARRVISTRLFQTVGFSPPREFYKVIFFNNIGRSGFAPQEIEQNSKVNIDVHALWYFTRKPEAIIVSLQIFCLSGLS